jgi:alkylation response protein AidB-like acyl-CoA dehydrogenase
VVLGGLDRPDRVDRLAVAVRGTDGGRVLSGSVVVEERRDHADIWCCVAAAADGEVLVVLVPASVWRPRARPVAGRAVPATVRESGADPVLCTVDLGGVGLVGAGLGGTLPGLGGATASGVIIGSLGGGVPWSDPDELLAHARIRLAAYLSGIAEGAQAAAVHHAARRLQFGRPILDNQALAFPLAQAQVELTALDLSIRHAARLADREPGGDGSVRDSRAVALAAAETLAMAQEAAATTVRLAMQVHGARALTAAEPVHAFYLALRSFGTVLGPRSPLWREAGLRRLTATAEAAGAGAAAG